MSAAEQVPVEALGQAMLLESFLDQATRHAINLLTLRMQLGRLHERCDPSDEAYPDGAERIRREVAALRPTLQSTLAIVDRLRARTNRTAPSEGAHTRTKAYEFLRICFPGTLPDPAEPTPPVDSACEKSYLWTLIRPGRPPVVVVQLFLSLSAQAAQLHDDHMGSERPDPVGRSWPLLLEGLLAQLAISACEFGDYTAEQVLLSMDLVAPESDGREALYPALWKTEHADAIARLDTSWRNLYRQVSALGRPLPDPGSAEALRQQYSPLGFWQQLGAYLEGLVDSLDAPLLDLYSNIRQTGRFPRGFFESPNQAPGAQTHSQSPDAGPGGRCRSLALLDPFSPQAPSSAAPRALSLASAERVVRRTPARPLLTRARSDVSPASPTEDVLHQRARLYTPQRPLVASDTDGAADDDDDDDDDGSSMGNVEMSPSQHASIKRQKSSDLAPMAAASSTPLRRRGGPGAPLARDDYAMDIEGTAIASSPTALLSAKRDGCVRPPSIQHTHTPLAFDRQASRNSSSSSSSSPPQEPLRSAADASTPSPRAGDRVQRYVADRTQGDIEGGGRPHRRRHGHAGLGTLSALPQTLLSPRNIAAARRKNGPLEPPSAQAAGMDGGSARGQPDTTPERSRDAGPQVTPEHQIGSAADDRTRSASRYVIRKEQGDVEGGGRKHRKRHASSMLM
ncbi:hypothetical protein GGF46_001117 [Coemansia sp. RSA 552]|nr:hypothetical protein GGF46_001117 [Coemansia sp. RSA 552]